MPLKLYLKNGFAKVLIGIGKGKKKYDKRDDLKKKMQNVKSSVLSVIAKSNSRFMQMSC